MAERALSIDEILAAPLMVVFETENNPFSVEQLIEQPEPLDPAVGVVNALIECAIC